MTDHNNDMHYFQSLDDAPTDKANNWSHSEWKDLRKNRGAESIGEMGEDAVDMLHQVGHLISRHVYVCGMEKESTDYKATVEAIVALFDKQIDEYGEQYE